MSGIIRITFVILSLLLPPNASLIDRPGVAGAVLQTASSFIHSFIN